MPKTAEISKIHSDEQHKGQAINQQQAASAQHKVDNTLRQVHAQENVQEAKIREKQEKNRKQNKDEEERKEKDQDQDKNRIIYNKDKKSSSNSQSSMIDIRL